MLSRQRALLLLTVLAQAIAGTAGVISLSGCLRQSAALQQAKSDKHHLPVSEPTPAIKQWENLRFGAFVSFNDNTCVGKELSKNTDPLIFNPEKLDFRSMMAVFHKAGIKYAVLTARHTSGFCLWDSRVTKFDVAASGFKKDVVKLFVEACREYDIKPCLYYCLWGKDWKPWEWNQQIRKELKGTSPREVTLTQLAELAENYGPIYAFWIDMQCWADPNLKPQEIYDLLKNKNPGTFVHFNQQVQDGTQIKYFPTDFLNGEERIPPEGGHKALREVDGRSFYLPFEYEITSQRCVSRTLGNGLMSGSCWFTYTDSEFYPVESLFEYIKKNYQRGGSNVLLSTAPEKTGLYRPADAESLLRLGMLICSIEK
jgi:alpha-L-fucosidase